NPNNGTPLVPLNLEPYFASTGTQGGLASLVGPFTVDSSGSLPTGQALPFTVHFQNDPQAATHVNQVRIVTQLDSDLDAGSFRLGGIQVGDISIHVPAGRALFQGDFDFTQTRGFILRVSAGVDLTAHQATWLLQAIDPLTGELIHDPSRGLLAPNNAQ